MPFYIRKSVSAGPFRFNFSKGGVGVSVGVKGLRVGSGPRGHYIYAGRGGLYYRATLGNAGRGRPSAVPQQRSPSPQATFDNNDVAMIEIDSGDVMHMQDEAFSELLSEINSKAAQTRMSAALAWTAIVIGVLAGMATGGPGLFLCIFALPGYAIGNWFDSYRRTTVLYYDLEGDAETAYNRLAAGFDGLSGCAAKWHIEAGGAVQSLTAWKRNAGASHLVNRKATTLAYKLPAVIKSNLTPPALHVGKQILFFMPDIVLVQDGSRVGAVNYTDLNVRWQDSRFIETERVPSDARVVDHTWAHPNKSGGPDRRFKNNRQIPICLYEAMHFTSNSGVNELLEFSRTGVAAAFVEGCRMLGKLPRGRTSPALPPPSANDIAAVVPMPATERKRESWKVASLALLAMVIWLPVLAVIFRPDNKKADTGLPPVLVAENSNRLSAGEKKDTLTTDSKVDPSPETTIAVETPVAVPASETTTLDPTETTASQKSGNATIRITKTAVNLREGAGTSFPVLTVVPKGIEVTVLEVDAGWSRVRVGGNTLGWMANSTMVEP
ncbi:SH3 domain-containing protein [Shinella sp. CPCC 101442]|uniref:SH3 domain-containing protein n=1 Tax=Shinella sp. CPCC 101442 TaxID=2932265 RepID=UPI0021521581|nr:SH3 domain-containing protein [Shinella sp. CPCC 101442]MCR6502116.1 SH3 domain-containing protein [Shinella sp. CPCC 101442]